jgi:iron complex transport system permease protein
MSRHLVLSSSRPEASLRLPRRALVVTMILAACVFIAVCLATAYGVYTISPFSVVRALIGNGSRLSVFVIRDIRLPRVLLGALVGGALALSGALLQGLSRNPLASPDILGINGGAAVVAVYLILGGASYSVVALGSFGGAIGVIVFLALVGIRRRFSIYRLLLVGVAVNVLCGAAIAYLIETTNAGTERTAKAQGWFFGTIEFATWRDVHYVAGAIVVLLPLVLALGRQLNVSQLGDDLAVGLGLRLNVLEIALALIAALLAAVVVAVAGPIGFVAFVAPNIARRLAGTPSAASLPVSMGIGALLLLLADYVGKRILEPTYELPVGITTVILGAPYLLYLLYKTERATGVA